MVTIELNRTRDKHYILTPPHQRPLIMVETGRLPKLLNVTKKMNIITDALMVYDIQSKFREAHNEIDQQVMEDRFLISDLGDKDFKSW